MEHGLLADKQAPLAQAVWTGTLLAIGIAALACWTAGALVLLKQTQAARVAQLAALVFACYAAVVLFVSRSFAIAIIDYLPAAAFLLIAFAVAYRRTRRRFLLAGLAGMVLTFIAAGVQQMHIDLDPRYFNYNALYHLIQAVAFILLFVAARALCTAEANLADNSAASHSGEALR